MRQFYLCGICDSYHAIEWDGDCRENDARFTCEALDDQFGREWEEVDMPTWNDAECVAH